MAGSKRAKLKKAFSPPTPVPVANADDRELMDELMAQLDSKNQTVQIESATVLNAMQLNKQAGQDKQDPKSRFKARQVSLVNWCQSKERHDLEWTGQKSLHVSAEVSCHRPRGRRKIKKRGRTRREDHRQNL
jgi:hypothetical protein